MSARTGCCAGATVYKVDSSNNLLWARDYFKGCAHSAVPSFLVPGDVLSSDQDASGNVYQAGCGNYPGVVYNWATPQVPPLFNVASWDSAGNLRWKWSEAPSGTLAFGLRAPPVKWARVRCSANGQILLGNGPTGGYFAGHAAAIDADANLLWWVDTDLGILIDGGKATSLWGNPPDSAYPGSLILIDNLTGALVTHLSALNFGATGIPITATLDHDDALYVSTGMTVGGSTVYYPMISKMVAGTVVWQFLTSAIFTNVMADPTDSPILMRADQDALIVGSGTRTVALSKVDGSVIWQVLTPVGAFTLAWWNGPSVPPRPYAAGQHFVPTFNWETLLDTHARSVLREWIDGRAAYGQASMDDCTLAYDRTSIWSGATRAQPANQLIAGAQCKWHVVNISGTLTWVKVFDDCHLCGRSACATPVDTPQPGQVQFTACGP